MSRIALFLVLALASTARAERRLSLEEALDLARHSNRDLTLARARLEQTAVAIDQAWVPLLPTLSAQGKYTHNYKEVDFNAAQSGEGFVAFGTTIATALMSPAVQAAVDNYNKSLSSIPNVVIQPSEQLDASVTATAPLIVPWGYDALTAARKTQDSNAAGVRVTETTVLYSTAQAFYAAAGADELVTARQHSVDVARRTLSDAQARFETGVVNRVEVMRAELALVRAEQARIESEDVAAQGYRLLATLTQLHEPFRVAPAEIAPATGLSVEDLVARAEGRRPEYVQYRRALDAADATGQSNKWRWLPSLSAFGNLRVFNYAGFSGDNYAWLVGAQLDWLAYDGGARDAGRRLALAQRREYETRLDLLRDSIADDVANAARSLITRTRALDTARRSVDLARNTLELVRVQHEAGTATQLELLQAQDAQVAAEVAVAQARFDLALGDLALRRAAGTFPDPR